MSHYNLFAFEAKLMLHVLRVKAVCIDVVRIRMEGKERCCWAEVYTRLSAPLWLTTQTVRLFLCVFVCVRENDSV